MLAVPEDKGSAFNLGQFFFFQYKWHMLCQTLTPFFLQQYDNCVNGVEVLIWKCHLAL